MPTTGSARVKRSDQRRARRRAWARRHWRSHWAAQTGRALAEARRHVPRRVISTPPSARSAARSASIRSDSALLLRAACSSRRPCGRRRNRLRPRPAAGDDPAGSCGVSPPPSSVMRRHVAAARAAAAAPFEEARANRTPGCGACIQHHPLDPRVSQEPSHFHPGLRERGFTTARIFPGRRARLRPAHPRRFGG